MRVLILSCVFPPEPVVSAQTSAQIAEELVRLGHEVVVVTAFPSRPGGKLYPGYRRKFYERCQTVEGYELIRCFSTLSSESTLYSRFLENISFGIFSGWAAFWLKRSDVIYANTWPLFAVGILLVSTRMRRIPLVVSVQDIYPESLVVQKRIQPDGWVARVLEWIDGVIARGSRSVIVISEKFAETYRNQRKMPLDRVHVVSNWIDESSIQVDDQRSEYRAAINIQSHSFLLAYGGNIGVAAGVETVIQALTHLMDADGLMLLIAGEGSNLKRCQQLVKELNIERIVFHSPWQVKETSKVLAAADVLVLPTRGNQSLASVPSKLISYMLSARPVIALATPGSDVAELIGRSGCGWIVSPDRPEELADTIRRVMSLSKAELSQRGQAGRVYALGTLSRKANLPRVVRILENAAK